MFFVVFLVVLELGFFCVCLGLVFLALVLFCWFFSSNLQRQKEENLMLL